MADSHENKKQKKKKKNGGEIKGYWFYKAPGSEFIQSGRG